MEVINCIKKMKELSKKFKKEGKIIGFVPTMGYLHKGHESLIQISKKKADITIVSIFVNPIQFGKNEDFSVYPRDFERDYKICEANQVDVIFAPEASEMYPKDFSTFIHNDTLANHLCGLTRKGHFTGVLTVVNKLFNIVNPDIVVFGQKDYQQCLIIKKMIEDLNMSIEFIMAPIVREDDGLAMSSRNKYLSDIERKDALVLYQSLEMAKNMIKNGENDVKKIKDAIKEKIKEKENAIIDYVEIVDAKTLEEITTIESSCLIALAVKFGNARLIDNALINYVEE